MEDFFRQIIFDGKAVYFGTYYGEKLLVQTYIHFVAQRAIEIDALT